MNGFPFTVAYLHYLCNFTSWMSVPVWHLGTACSSLAHLNIKCYKFKSIHLQTTIKQSRIHIFFIFSLAVSHWDYKFKANTKLISMKNRH